MRFADGIFRLTLDKEIKGTTKQAWEWIHCMSDISSQLGRPFPLLTMVDYKVEFTSEGRRIMRSAGDEEVFIAHAMLAKTMAKKAMVKFLMVLVPRNLFDEDVFLKEENCISWLQENMVKASHAIVTEEEAAALNLSIRNEPRII